MQGLAPSAPSVMHPGIPMQSGSVQFGCSDSFQQALILCPPTIQGKHALLSPCVLSRLACSMLGHYQMYFVCCEVSCPPPVSPGIPTNGAKPSGYSVRMDTAVPLVTQAPPIQPLQIRPGVMTQVSRTVAIITATTFHRICSSACITQSDMHVSV